MVVIINVIPLHCHLYGALYIYLLLSFFFSVLRSRFRVVVKRMDSGTKVSGFRFGSASC